jgi:hypothetical protein
MRPAADLPEIEKRAIGIIPKRYHVHKTPKESSEYEEKEVHELTI